MAIAFSLDSRYQRDFDLESTVQALTAVSHGDFWPPLSDSKEATGSKRKR
jgi:hypothetical protein